MHLLFSEFILISVSLSPSSTNSPEFNPIAIPINVRPRAVANNRPLIDENLLRSLVFVPPRYNPLKFIRQFESAFQASVPQDQKSVWLRQFVCRNDLSLFDAAFEGDINTSFDRFKTIFIKTYFRPYAEFRKNELNLHFDDVSSIVDFATRKIEVYENVEGVSTETATERVFYELPLDICDQFILRNAELTKENLLTFLTYSDFVIQSQFLHLNSRTNNVRLNDANNSGQRGVSRSMPGASPAPRSAIDLGEDQLFLDLESDADDNDSAPEEIDEEILMGLDLPIPEPPGIHNRTSEKRDNPDGEVAAKRKRGRPRKNSNIN